MGVNTGGVRHVTQSCKFIEVLLTFTRKTHFHIKGFAPGLAELNSLLSNVTNNVQYVSVFPSTFKLQNIISLVEPHRTRSVEDLFCLHCRL